MLLLINRDKAKRWHGDETFVQGVMRLWTKWFNVVIAETACVAVRLLISAQFLIKGAREYQATGAVSYMFDNTGVIVYLKGTGLTIF